MSAKLKSPRFKHKSGGWRNLRWPDPAVVLYLFNAQKEITHKAQHCYLLHTVALTVPCSPAVSPALVPLERAPDTKEWSLAGRMINFEDVYKYCEEFFGE